MAQERGIRFTSEGGFGLMTQDEIDDIKGEGSCVAGGYRAARNAHLDKLAKACQERNIEEVQRLAAYTLSWNGRSQPFSGDDPEFKALLAKVGAA